MRCTPDGTIVLLALMLLATPAAAQVAGPDDASLLAADAEQKRIIVDQDLDAQRRFMHDHYIINAPANRVLRKADALAIMARGGNAAERFDRVIEGHQITGNIGIVMGREVVQPTAGGCSRPPRNRDRGLDGRFAVTYGGQTSPSCPGCGPSSSHVLVA